jgi:endonuclease IV
MKKASTILSHIQSLPEFKLLKSHYCYQKFISLLNPRFKKAIAFVYVRDDTLFVALSHPGFKMELNYNKDLLKSLLTMLAKSDEKCKDMKASKVILFNSKHLSIIKEETIESTVPYYRELALGEFTIESEDEELQEAFNKIKKSIEKQL